MNADTKPAIIIRWDDFSQVALHGQPRVARLPIHEMELSAARRILFQCVLEQFTEIHLVGLPLSRISDQMNVPSAAP